MHPEPRHEHDRRPRHVPTGLEVGVFQRVQVDIAPLVEGDLKTPARAIYGDTPEIACAVEAIEIEENLHRRELSPALRKTYTARLKALHEQEHPKSKGGRPSKTVPKAGKVSKPERFTKAHAKRTGRSEAAVQQDVAEATALGDDVMKKIVGTSLDKPARCGTLRIEAVRRDRRLFSPSAAARCHHAPARPTLFATRPKSPLRPAALGSRVLLPSPSARRSRVARAGARRRLGDRR